MEMKEILRRNSRHGNKIRPSEFSDRIMGMNRLEERILQDRLRQIDREKRFSLSLLNRDIRMIEKDLEAKQESLQALYNKEKLKILHENLHIVLLAKERLAEKIRLHNLKNNQEAANAKRSEEDGEEEEERKIASSRQTNVSSSSLSDLESRQEIGRMKYVTRVHEVSSATSARPKSNLSLALSKRRPKSAKASFNFIRSSSSSASSVASSSSTSNKNATKSTRKQQTVENLTQSSPSSSFSLRSNNNRSQSSLSSARLSDSMTSKKSSASRVIKSSMSDAMSQHQSTIDSNNNNENTNNDDFNRKLSDLINANTSFLLNDNDDNDSNSRSLSKQTGQVSSIILPLNSNHRQQKNNQKLNAENRKNVANKLNQQQETKEQVNNDSTRQLPSMRRKSSSSNEFYKFVSTSNKRDSTISLANKNDRIHIQTLDGTALDNNNVSNLSRRQSNNNNNSNNKPMIINQLARNRNSIARSSISDIQTTTSVNLLGNNNNNNNNDLIVRNLKLPVIAKTALQENKTNKSTNNINKRNTKQ